MGSALFLDGEQPIRSFPDSGCCKPDICEISLCALICNFIQLLPSGTMWDSQKESAMSRYTSQDCHGAVCSDVFNEDCSSVVNYAAYSARLLHHHIFDALWPSIRESDPRTAFTTLDEWLDRLGWEDCYFSSCRNPMLGRIAPFEIEGECGPVYCGTSCASAELTRAVKRGIVLALTRLAMKPVKTLSNLNWIVEPLGAVITPREESFPEDNSCPDFYQFNICPNSDKTIDSAPSDGNCGFVPIKIPAHCESSCEGFGTFYPGVAAAFCIIISLFASRGCCDQPVLVYNENC